MDTPVIAPELLMELGLVIIAPGTSNVTNVPAFVVLVPARGVVMREAPGLPRVCKQAA